MNISIIIPNYNHIYYLNKNIPLIIDYLKNKKLSYEIIVIDDGSNKTPKLNYPNCIVLSNKKNMGKGFSVRKGLKFAKGDKFLMTDADLACPINEFEKLWKFRDKDIVIGSRMLEDSKVKNSYGIRRFLGSIYPKIVKSLFNLNVNDTQCGFKLFNKKIKNTIIKCIINGFSFDVELLLIAKKQGLVIKEVGIDWESKSGSKVIIWKHPIIMFYDLLKIKYNEMIRKYD